VPKTILLTIGNFDGVHLGHQQLVAELKLIKDSIDPSSKLVVLTFEPHPIEVLRPGIEVERLTPPTLKATLLKSYGVDEVLLQNFDLDLATMSAEDFFHKILVNKIGCRHLVVGENFKFGSSQSGDIETLQRLGQAAGVEIHVINKLLDGQEVVSSSRIRKALAGGDLETATRLLGRFHQILGTVVHGDKRGTQIGVPTANLRITSACKKSAIPKAGVYVTRSSIDGDQSLQAVRSVTNIGYRPTISATNSDTKVLSIETHILNPAGDLYGKMMSVEFLYRIREEIRFSSLDELKLQIHKDIQFSRSYLPHL
jgi:riboflavin kinase/FMN adenylyltransferase